MTIEQQIKLALLLLWIDVAKEYDIEYKIVERNGDYVAIAGNPEEARIRNFGSITLGVVSEFWFNKAMSRFRRRVKDRKVLTAYLNLVKELDHRGFRTPYPPS